jgi:hypothetical protein
MLILDKNKGEEDEEEEERQPPRKISKSNEEEKELMPDADPPKIYSTLDNIEWTFIRTFSDHDKMDEFRYVNHCECSSRGKTCWRQVRFPCLRKSSDNCQFMLLAMRSTKQRFHVYKHGQHQHNNHPVPVFKPRSKWKI